MPHQLKDKDVHDDLMHALTARFANDAAAKLLRKGFLSGGKYAPYFGLLCAGDGDVTLRIVMVSAGDVPKKTVELYGHDAEATLEKPGVLYKIAKSAGAKYAVVCLFDPDGREIPELFAMAQRMFFALKSVELYDFIWINGGRTYSVVRETKRKISAK